MIDVEAARPAGDSGRASTPARWWLPSSWVPVAAAATLLAVLWAAVVAVDVVAIGGSRDVMVRIGGDHPHLYYRLFANNHPVEWAQWAVLGMAAVAFAAAAGMFAAFRARPEATCWVLLSLGLAIFALNDAGEPRHVTSYYVDGLFGDAAGTLVELAFLTAIAALPVFVLVRHGRTILASAQARGYLLAAYGIYAVVGLATSTRRAWFAAAGDFVAENILGGRLLPVGPSVREAGLTGGFLIIDALAMESVELLGAACFLGAALALLHRLRGRAADDAPF